MPRYEDTAPALAEAAKATDLYADDASAPPLRAEDVVISRADLAAAIRALPLPEDAPPTPREKLRRVREAREVLATARVAYVPRAAAGADEVVINAATEAKIAVLKRASFKLRDLTAWVELKDRTVYQSERPDDWRSWVLDTLRVEGWDVVEDGEGDG